MKKQLLFATGILASGIISAQTSRKVSNIPANIANKSAIKERVIFGNESTVTSNVTTKPNVSTLNYNKTSTINSTVIGTTYYDLQSNSSVGDRIVVNPDGTIATVWTMAPTQSGPNYTDRGTGYNYFNGTTWMPNPTVRIEATRVGWGNIVNTRTNKEVILSHTGTLLNLASRATKGSGTFVESTTAVPTATAGGNLWPRMVSAGDTIYAISVTQSTATAGAAIYQGLNGAVCFSRSKNAGATWDIVNAIPTGLDATKFLGHGGDSYAIAANGSTVVIVAGDSGKDLVLCKSTDAGATWTSKVVLKFPITLWDPATMTTDKNGDSVPDTIETNDGNLSVGLDNSNQAYVFYGRSRILQTTPQTNGSYSYFPGTDGLMMWKESFAANTDTGGILVAAVEDIRTLGVIEIPNPANPLLGFGRWGCSLTSYPSVAFDASNTMYLSYSSLVDSLFSLPNPDKSLRHTYIIKSTDGGINWTNPCDISGGKDDTRECIFGSMAKKVDGFVHLIYQRDYAAGNGIPGTTTSPNPDESENTFNNDIVYVKIPVGDIGTCNVGSGIGVKELSNSVSNISFYPNPASANGTVEVVLTENAKMEVVVLNSVGQVISSTLVNANAGSNKVNINTANLSSGLYFYQVRIANNKSITQKFVVEK